MEKDQQLLQGELTLIEELRQKLVVEILARTSLSKGDFTIDIDISYAEDAGNDFYEAARGLWQHDENDGTVWYTTEEPENGATVVFGGLKGEHHQNKKEKK